MYHFNASAILLYMYYAQCVLRIAHIAYTRPGCGANDVIVSAVIIIGES